MRVADRFSPGPHASTSMVLASGQQFPDALGGAVLAAVRGVPLLLTPSACHATVTARLADERDQR
ncbi:cell wall-binding repeat-containing protein, partial [Burkholderia cenocepacia]